MTGIEDRPTTEERYVRAIRSSDLEVDEHRGDVDLLIAAGWCHETLGTMLYRLACEFDSVKSEQHLANVEIVRAGKAILARHAEAAELERKPLKPEEVEAAARAVKRILADADSMRRQAEAAHVTARLLILQRMKSLDATKAALGRWACVQATKRNFPANDAEVAKLAGRVLNVFLDPTCSSCQGRGANGGYRAPQVICRACSGSGKRKTNLGKDAGERWFAQYLLAEMESMLAEIDRQMRSYLRGDPRPAYNPPTLSPVRPAE